MTRSSICIAVDAGRSSLAASPSARSCICRSRSGSRTDSPTRGLSTATARTTRRRAASNKSMPSSMRSMTPRARFNASRSSTMGGMIPLHGSGAVQCRRRASRRRGAARPPAFHSGQTGVDGPRLPPSQTRHGKTDCSETLLPAPSQHTGRVDVLTWVNFRQRKQSGACAGGCLSTLLSDHAIRPCLCAMLAAASPATTCLR